MKKIINNIVVDFSSYYKCVNSNGRIYDEKMFKIAIEEYLRKTNPILYKRKDRIEKYKKLFK